MICCDCCDGCERYLCARHRQIRFSFLSVVFSCMVDTNNENAVFDWLENVMRRYPNLGGCAFVAYSQLRRLCCFTKLPEHFQINNLKVEKTRGCPSLTMTLSVSYRFLITTDYVLLDETHYFPCCIEGRSPFGP